MIGRGNARTTLWRLSWARGRVLAFAAIAASGWGLGCDPEPVVRVHVCGDAAVPGELDALRVSLADEGLVEVFSGVHELLVLDPMGAPDAGTPADGSTPDGGETEEADGGSGEAADGGPGGDPEGCVPGTAQALPVSFELRGGRGRMWVVVEALSGGVVVGRTEARVEVPPSGTTDVTLPLDASCLRMHCPFGQTCVRGQCEIAVFGGDPLACEGEPETGEVTEVCVLPEEAP